jgi:hypothetical protein
MRKFKRHFLYLLSVAFIAAGCSKSSDSGSASTGTNTGTNTGGGTGQYPAAPSSNPNGYSTIINADCSITQGNVMRIEQANVHSTTSPLPSEKSRTWIQGMNHTTIRTWLALSTIYNKGYTYKYDGGADAETSLAYYSTCADSLLIALTAYNGSVSAPVPAKPTAFQSFLTQTLIYYKNKFPKIKYIEAGNEPDYLGEEVADYYENYKYYYKAVNAANTQLGLTGSNRILLSNAPFTSSTSSGGNITYTYTAAFLALYKADTDPGKRLDFFSVHCYNGINDPITLKTVKPQITATLATNGLAALPVFITEYGMVGGEFIPSGWSESDMVTTWPAAQLAKAFYLYDGGCDRVFNWCINHGTILHKSELGDLTNATPNPYGNALLFAKEVSARGTRIKVTSSKLSSAGLGINALASMGNSKGVAILVWNYNYTNAVADQNINVQLSNIPQANFPDGKMNVKVYMLDSNNNNFFNNANQNTLKTTSDNTYAYSSSLATSLKLQQNSVALIVVTP